MARAPRRSSRPNGELKLDIPHDRQATFERQLAGKYQCRLPGFYDHVISMYARGMSVRLIQGHLLRLSFADVDFLNPNLSKRPRDKLARTFTAEQAQAIHSFVEALPIEIVSMVIHCEGGHHGHAPSPWRAIGYMAINRIVHLSHANPAIVRIMIGNDRTTHRERQRARD